MAIFLYLCRITLGDEEKARDLFEKLIAYGKEHLNDNCRIDYFAVSLPDPDIWNDDLNLRNRIHCNHVMELGYLGVGDIKKAEECRKQGREAETCR